MLSPPLASPTAIDDFTESVEITESLLLYASALFHSQFPASSIFESHVLSGSDHYLSIACSGTDSLRQSGLMDDPTLIAVSLSYSISHDLFATCKPGSQLFRKSSIRGLNTSSDHSWSCDFTLPDSYDEASLMAERKLSPVSSDIST
jgi:hypothetical protein